MPRTTRAVDRSSHFRAPVDTRAVHGSSHHRSSSESLESGRERRRKGKLKMQQQLTAARSRISDLEQQNHCLRCLVEELTRNIALPAGPASPELFDVYDIAEETSSVATQTDISVDLTKLDIFACSQDLPQHSSTNAPAHGTTAHADAAAGHGCHPNPQQTVLPEQTQCGPLPLDFTAAGQHTTLDKLRDLKSISQDSQDLAISSGHLDVVTPREHCILHAVAEPQLAQCGPLHRSANDFPSQDLASLDSSFHYLVPSTGNCMGASQEADVPLATGRRQALDDVNSEQRCASGNGTLSQADTLGQSQLGQPKQCGPLPLVFNSQDLAVSSGPLEVVTRNGEHCNTQAADEPSISQDQDLAISSGHHVVVTPGSGHCQVLTVEDPQRTQCGPLPRSAKDFLSHDLACLGSTGLHLAPSDGNCIGATREDVVPPVTGRRQALDVVNTEHRCPIGSGNLSQVDPLVQSHIGQRTQCGPLPLVFNSQDLALSSGILEVVTRCIQHCNTHTVGEPQQTQCGPTQSNSQDLASASRHLGAGTLGREQCQSHAVVGSLQTPCGPLPLIAKDCPSQDLACLDSQGQLEDVTTSSEQCDTHAVAEPQQAQCGPLPLTAKDFTSQDLASVDSKLQCLAHSTGNCTGASQEADGSLATGRRQALDDVNSEQRCASGSGGTVLDDPLTFGPSTHELTQCEPMSQTAIVKDSDHLHSSLTLGPSTHEQHNLLAEFQAAAAPVIAAYKRRHKPSNGQVRRASSTICSIAKKYGVTKEQCCRHLREHSLALTTAATDLF